MNNIDLTNITEGTWEILAKLDKDTKDASKLLTRQEARYIVDMYYISQANRIRCNNQIRKLDIPEDEEPNSVIQHFAHNFEVLEAQMKNVLKHYVKSQDIGKWLISITGIGEVIAAGLIAHIDITRVESAGQIQAYAGQDPTKEWGKGEKRPWNASLKQIVYLVEESFVKQKSRESDVYGKLYDKRKEYEQAKNENGDYTDQAAEALREKKYGKETDAYKCYIEGKLPPAQIDRRCKRWMAKIFLAHLFEVWYELDRGIKPPRPYAIEHLGHVHYMPPPNRAVIDEIIAKRKDI